MELTFVSVFTTSRHNDGDNPAIWVECVKIFPLYGIWWRGDVFVPGDVEKDLEAFRNHDRC